MYYPYLRARQFELISLRNLVEEKQCENIKPIIEPVKRSLNNLDLANRTFSKYCFQPYLIVNPLQGEIAGDTKILLKYISELEDSQYLAAFHYTNNKDYITESIESYNLSNCLLILLEGFTDNQELRDLCNNPKITHIMLFEPHMQRSLDKHLKSLPKAYIKLNDIFEKQVRNADYLDMQAHKLTEEHLYFKDDKYDGFGDFTVLPSQFTEGGSTPRAVVIHLSYIDNSHDSEIWIRHFTSDTNDSIANIQGKFSEAAAKAITFCNQNNFDNIAINELRNYSQTEKYPGLGTVKKISIMNHLIIINNYFANND